MTPRFSIRNLRSKYLKSRGLNDPEIFEKEFAKQIPKETNINWKILI